MGGLDICRVARHWVNPLYSHFAIFESFSMRLIAALFSLFIFHQSAFALEVQKVTDGVYAIIGEKAQRSPQNLANNATFGVVVTGDGVVLVDSGGSWKGAEALDKVIAGITDKPVKIVINSGGQDHRWLGNGYWKAKGAKIIASQAAVADHKDRGSLQFTMLDNLLGQQLAGTEAVYADTTFEREYKFTLGGVAFEIFHTGQAHTPGDSFIWLKDRKVMFTGDIVYVDRLLGVGPQSNSKSWIAVFNAMAAYKPLHIVPGHGRATTLVKAKAETLDYLVNLRQKIAAHIENGGDMIGSVKVDQSKFSRLLQFDALARRNAQQVYAEMEFE